MNIHNNINYLHCVYINIIIITLRYVNNLDDIINVLIF